jgi:hypothetical protein
MDSDRQSLQAPRPGQCPLCSSPLKPGALICYFCGFSAPMQKQERTPAGRRSRPETTPIPPRASAHPVRVRSRYATIDARPAGPQGRRGRPTTPLWQHESPAFQAQSSLPALTLVISDLPTRPEAGADEATCAAGPPAVASSSAGAPAGAPTAAAPPRPEEERRRAHLASLAELATLPPSAAASSATPPAPLPAPPRPEEERRRAHLASLAEIDTQPSAALSPASPPAVSQTIAAVRPRRGAPIRWRPGRALQPRDGEELSQPGRSSPDLSRLARPHLLNPLERLRWWLLRPGNIEFLLWIGGTLLLLSTTCLLMLAILLSSGWLRSASGTATGPAGQAHQQPAASLTTTPGLSLARLDRGPLQPGQTLRLRGSGFSPFAPVMFWLDNRAAFLDSHGRPVLIECDGHGTFTASLTLQARWPAGPHFVLARDLQTHHIALLTFTLAAPATSSHATLTPTSTSAAGSAPQPLASAPPAPSSVPPTASATPGRTPSVTATVTRTRPTPTPTATASTAPVPTASATSTTQQASPGAGASAQPVQSATSGAAPSSSPRRSLLLASAPAGDGPPSDLPLLIACSLSLALPAVLAALRACRRARRARAATRVI